MTGTYVRCASDKTKYPLVLIGFGSTPGDSWIGGDTKLLGEEELCAIDYSFVHLQITRISVRQSGAFMWEIGGGGNILLEQRLPSNKERRANKASRAGAIDVSSHAVRSLCHPRKAAQAAQKLQQGFPVQFTLNARKATSRLVPTWVRIRTHRPLG